MTPDGTTCMLALALLVCASAASPREAVPPGVAPGFVAPCAAPLHSRAWGRARHYRARGRRAPLATACAGAADAAGGNVRGGDGGDGAEGRAHDSWALLLRHHANTEWHGVRSEYRLSNTLTLRTHHGRPGKRVRVLDADNHGTVVSSLRPVRKKDVGGQGGGEGEGGGSGWGECLWTEEEEYQLRHLRPEGAAYPAPELPQPVRCVREMDGADGGAVTCLEDAFCRAWLRYASVTRSVLPLDSASFDSERLTCAPQPLCIWWPDAERGVRTTFR